MRRPAGLAALLPGFARRFLDLLGVIRDYVHELLQIAVLKHLGRPLPPKVLGELLLLCKPRQPLASSRAFSSGSDRQARLTKEPLKPAPGDGLGFLVAKDHDIRSRLAVGEGIAKL